MPLQAERQAQLLRCLFVRFSAGTYAVEVLPETVGIAEEVLWVVQCFVDETF